ncbi:hypothetical protein, partial [Burkholderia pseudomallei]|uniref:hypothetical protein n=1 Tax=Burkholderia pseudomallei TaxID=28450 RepID=UPI001177C977
MPALPNPSRRHALKILAGAPMLPLSGVALPALLSGCGGDDDVAAAKKKKNKKNKKNKKKKKKIKK